MVDGTSRFPSKLISFNTRALVVKQKDVFQIGNQAQTKTLIFVPQFNPPVAGTVARVKMNAKMRRP